MVFLKSLYRLIVQAWDGELNLYMTIFSIITELETLEVQQVGVVWECWQ